VDGVLIANTDLGNFSLSKPGSAEYEGLVKKIHDATLKAGKWERPIPHMRRDGQTAKDMLFFQNGPSFDGYQPPGGRGGRGGRGGPAPPLRSETCSWRASLRARGAKTSVRAAGTCACAASFLGLDHNRARPLRVVLAVADQLTAQLLAGRLYFAARADGPGDQDMRTRRGVCPVE
jgi:hypothetical protein